MFATAGSAQRQPHRLRNVGADLAQPPCAEVVAGDRRQRVQRRHEGDEDGRIDAAAERDAGQVVG
jgi:hypothetical protein